MRSTDELLDACAECYIPKVFSEEECLVDGAVSVPQVGTLWRAHMCAKTLDGAVGPMKPFSADLSIRRRYSQACRVSKRGETVICQNSIRAGARDDDLMTISVSVGSRPHQRRRLTATYIQRLGKAIPHVIEERAVVCPGIDEGNVSSPGEIWRASQRQDRCEKDGRKKGKHDKSLVRRGR